MDIKDKAKKISCPYFEPSCKIESCECIKYKAYIDASNPDKVESKLKEMGIDVKQDKWLLLMNMQKRFASRFHKVDELTKDEMDYWIDKYLICIEDEIREVREHLNIYPDGYFNHNNREEELKKEIIDILHFVMNEFICGGATAKIIERYYLKLFSPYVDEVNDFLSFAYYNQVNEVNLYYNKKSRYNKDEAILLLTNKLLDCNGKVRQCISWKHWKNPYDEIDFDALNKAFALTFKTLIDLFIIVDVDPDNIKNIYLNKNMENIFRQEYGY